MRPRRALPLKRLRQSVTALLVPPVLAIKECVLAACGAWATLSHPARLPLPSEKRAPAVQLAGAQPEAQGLGEAPRLPQALTQLAFAVGHLASRPGSWRVSRICPRGIAHSREGADDVAIRVERQERPLTCMMNADSHR
jgi:hypothetical protein